MVELVVIDAGLTNLNNNNNSTNFICTQLEIK